MGDSSPTHGSVSLATEFLTPRSKVAKMLADIDDAPTPSPSQGLTSKALDLDTAVKPTPVSNTGQSLEGGLPAQNSNDEDGSLASSNEDDSDDAVRRPQGRAARRMLDAEQSSARSSPAKKAAISPPLRQTQEDSDDDLYSTTPMKPREPANEAPNSPIGSEKGNSLFVSPAKSSHAGSEDELPSNPFGGKDKLAELVAQKRAERLAKEADDEERKKRVASLQVSSDLPEEAFEGPQDAVDLNIERIMSDASRPARKASKRALLEMERETQRLARQQALAHQMKVKKKFTTSDLIAKFNFRQPGMAPTISNDQQHGGDTTASSAPNSDGVEPKDPVSTPPSSPLTPLDRQRELVDYGALSKLVPVRQDSIASLADGGEDEGLLGTAEVMRSSQMRKKEQAALREEVQPEKKGLKLARLGKKAVIAQDDSDDELEIVDRLPPHLRAFAKAATTSRTGRPADSKAIHNLKHLSHLHANDSAPHKPGSRPSLNTRTLESQLRRRAKEQARRQELERIEELRAKGIEVQTMEEREKEAEAFESLLEKARQEAVDLRKAEKAALKEAGGEEGAAAVSSDEDEDYEASGSDEEGEEEEEREWNGLVDEVAEETDEEEEVDGSDDELETDEPAEQLMGTEAGDEFPGEFDVEDRVVREPTGAARKSRKSRIVKDEDDEDLDQDEQEDCGVAENGAEDSEDPFAAFNFDNGNNESLLLSPTQAFNATMRTPTQATQEDSLDILRRIAPPSTSFLPPTFSGYESQRQEETQLSFVAGSQVPESQRISLNWETQPPETPVPAGLSRDVSALSETPGWEPTQDTGLHSPWTVQPKLRREGTLDSLDDHETQSTVQLRVSESPAPSQNVPRRGRLVRRQAAVADDSDDDDSAPMASVTPERRDAFREMARRRKEALTAAERADAEKEMRHMMDEQAEESEDEYAGLGGDDFVAPENEQDKAMIDSSHVDVDERALAAHFAERQRQRDEAETSKLYTDLTTGVLRKKMGASAFDLDEDEDELAVRRRQMRQREEARKRKALLKDENIATLAEGKQSKGKDAFLKAIADDDGDDEMVHFSDDAEESTPAAQDESQPSQRPPDTGPLKETSGNKRPFAEDGDGFEERPPAKQRRTQMSTFRRPTSMLEVQESVSFLLEEPHAGGTFGPTAVELSSDSEGEYNSDRVSEFEDDGEADFAAEEARQNDGGFAPNPASMDAKIMPPPRLPAPQRRTAHKPAIVDRLSLKRGSSSSDSALGRTAWASGPATGGFKVPSLLRRATTSSNSSGANERGVTTPNITREGSGVKMGGSKKSSLAYQARAEERRAIVEVSAKRREENTRRIAMMRRNSSALSRGLTGRFE